jgi:hypothetical protein
MKADAAFYDDARSKAHAYYLQGWSYRNIAETVLPGRTGGFVTIRRWATKSNEDGITWEQEKHDLAKEQRDLDRQRYLNIISEVKDRNLQIAAKASLAIELSLDAFFEYDLAGKPTGVKLNPKSGLPIIGARDMAPMLHAITELHGKTLGLDQLLPDEVAGTVTHSPVVEATAMDKETMKRVGDYLALESMTVVESNP